MVAAGTLLFAVTYTYTGYPAIRTDPAQAGPSCCVGDIGTHGKNLLGFVSSQSIQSLCADVSSFVDGRTLDDDANILVRLSGVAQYADFQAGG